eukprot:2398269-Alexandrium_andersonii.AAC.1
MVAPPERAGNCPKQLGAAGKYLRRFVTLRCLAVSPVAFAALPGVAFAAFGCWCQDRCSCCRDASSESALVDICSVAWMVGAPCMGPLNGACQCLRGPRVHPCAVPTCKGAGTPKVRPPTPWADMLWRLPGGSPSTRW